MAGDPPLEQVVTRTLEAGLRGGEEGRFKMECRLVSQREPQRHSIRGVGTDGLWLFQELWQTRREGLERRPERESGVSILGAVIHFLVRPIRAREQVNGESNSTSDATLRGLEGLIEIKPGARIPLIPQHLLKAFADLQATSKLSLNFEVVGSSSAFARGNENN